MLMSAAEIEVLRLCAWCKDLPLSCSKFVSSDIVSLLGQLQCLRQSRCGQSYRVTPQGYSLLEQAGLQYPPDKQYRGQGAVLTRRLHSAELVLFFHSLGADVFLETPVPTDQIFSYLPSFALRRKKGANALGGTRLAGFLYAKEITYIPYFIDAANDGIYPNVEERTFTASKLLCGKTPVVLYTGAADLETLISTAEKTRSRKIKSTTQTYAKATDLFGCPVCYVPLSENGAKQLRIISQPEYQKTLIKQILGKDYEPALTTQYDAWHKQTKTPYLIGIDCDFNRFKRAMAGGQTIHIILLANQLAAVGKQLQGHNAILHPLHTEVVEAALGLPSTLTTPGLSPFITPKGEYINAPSFNKN